MRTHKTWVEIDTRALLNNYDALCAVLGKERVAPVLKANAYGHGDEIVCQALPAVARLCVQDVWEAERLLSYGYRGIVLVMGGQLPSLLQGGFQDKGNLPANIELTAGDFQFLQAWCQAKYKPKLHLKFDTGMGRQGFSPDDAPRVAAAVAPFKSHIVGVSSHFADAGDTFSPKYPTYQMERFAAVCRVMRDAGLVFQQHHAASAAALLLPSSRHDFCRIGISLYGFWTTATAKTMYAKQNKTVPTLKPILSWRAVLIAVRQLPAGSYIGYGCNYCTTRATKIAILPVGYFDGYPRQASGSYAYVLVRGKRCPILGVVCMNMLVIDVAHLEGVQVGDIATLIGTDGEECLAAEQLAAWANTISYDITTRLHPSMPRQIVKHL